MKSLKAIASKIAARFSRIWEKATVLDHETYLREREIMAARERAREKYMLYGRGGWL